MKAAILVALLGLGLLVPLAMPTLGQAGGGFSETQVQQGLQGCGAGWRPAVGVPGVLSVSGVAGCGLLAAAGVEGFDRFLLDWVLLQPTANWTSAAFEMTWTVNQPAATNLSMIWEVTGCVNMPALRFAAVAGPSPLSVTIDQARIQEVLAVAQAGAQCPAAAVNCGDEFCALTSRVFPAPGLLGPDAPADVGLTVQQPFTQTFTAVLSS